MTTGLVLIAAILILGGVIATVGDRLGMRVGKARLSLFNLRPRQTATLITIMTGVVISAVTFGILFAISDQLRTGVFELSNIQEDLATAREELQQARTEQETVQAERDLALRQQQMARRRLQRTNQELQRAIAQSQVRERQLQQTNTQLSSTQDQLQQVESSFQEARGLLQSVSQQARQLRTEIDQLQRDRGEQIAQREAEIARRDREIADREGQLATLEEQRSILVQAVAELEQEFQVLRQGNVALLRNQPLNANLVQVSDPDNVPQVVRELLQNANRAALLRILPGTTLVDRQVLAITSNQVEQLLNQLRDGKEYVVQVISAGNYVVGEPCVVAGETCIQVFISTALNELLFPNEAVLATANLRPSRLTTPQLTEQYYILIRTAQFRMRQAGVLTDTQLQIADGQPETIERFFTALQELEGVVEVQARSESPIRTGGPNPIVLDLVARQDGQDLFSALSLR